jgi:AcrR family transcriptional regulator
VSQAHSPPGPDRRQRRKAATRRRLLDAATRLFAKQGFEATRPQDIAREADVAIGTFYLHFADRRAAFLAFTERAAEELMEHARERASNQGPFDTRLRAYLAALLDYVDENPGVIGAAFANEAVIGAEPAQGASGSLRDRLAQGLADGLRRGMASGEFRSDYDPQLVGYAMVGLIQQALTRGTQLGLDRESVLDQITRFCAQALAVAPADRRSEESCEATPEGEPDR